MKESADSHPYAQWVTVIDPNCAEACKELCRKAWRVDGKALSDLVRIHISQKHPHCRCRLRPMSLSAISLEKVQLMD
jgi:hypothetical protein